MGTAFAEQTTLNLRQCAARADHEQHLEITEGGTTEPGHFVVDRVFVG